MFLGESGNDMREELGLTKERANELMRITHSIVRNHATNGMGRTSHILLSISGRKDLNDTEKVICSFIFACEFSENMYGEGREGREGPRTTHFDIGSEMNMGMNMDCVVIAPDGMKKRDVVALTMAMLMSQLKEMPCSVRKDFCKSVSILFAKIAESGEVKL